LFDGHEADIRGEGRHPGKGAVLFRYFGVCYGFAPWIQRRMVWYSGESFSQRMPPPWGRTFDPSTPSDSEPEVGLRRMRLFSGSLRSTTLSAVSYVALKRVWVA